MDRSLLLFDHVECIFPADLVVEVIKVSSPYFFLVFGLPSIFSCFFIKFLVVPFLGGRGVSLGTQKHFWNIWNKIANKKDLLDLITTLKNLPVSALALQPQHGAHSKAVLDDSLKITEIHFFTIYVFVHNRSLLDILPNFNLLSTLQCAFFGPLFPRI